MATIGYTTIAGTIESLSGTLSIGNITNTYVASSGDIVTSISYYGAAITGNPTIDVGVYTFSGGLPVSLIGKGTITMTSTTPQWWTTSVSLSLTGGTTYCVAQGNPTGSGNGYRDTSGTYSLDITDGSGPLPSTWHSGGTANFSYSFYATVGSGTVTTTSPLSILGAG